jgi:hypothetical protein
MPYDLLVANDTPSPLTAFAYAGTGRPSSSRQTWNTIVVPPYSAIALAVEFPLPGRGRSAQVGARLISEDAQLTFAAPPPQRPARGPSLRAATSAALVASLALLLWLLAGMQPRVVALAAPAAVAGGTPFAVAYALVDSREGGYDVLTPAGQLVGTGHLPSGSGAFTLTLPAGTVSNGYDIRVTAHGPFGTSERTTHVVALAASAAPPPSRRPPPPIARDRSARIGAIGVAHDVVHGGQPIVVDYRTTAQTGSVRLIDQQGTVRAQALLNRGGRSLIVAPYGPVDQDVQVVVSTERGSAHDERAVSVRVLRMLPPTMLDGDPEQGTAARGDADGDGTSPIAVNALADDGTPIIVAILRHEPALHIALVDATGAELYAASVPPGAAFVSLPAPRGKGAARLSVIASFAKGFTQETVIRAVTVGPKPTH